MDRLAGRATFLGVLLDLTLTATLVVRTTEAVFSGYVSTPANTWSTGGAVISTDAAATAVLPAHRRHPHR